MDRSCLGVNTIKYALRYPQSLLSNQCDSCETCLLCLMFFVMIVELHYIHSYSSVAMPG